MESILLQAVIYLVAAVVAVPIAQRLGLGSVLGYLIAGMVIGPLLGLVGDETRDLQHFAEFGVVMMLFVVGLELEPRALWAMRARLLGLGGMQVLGTTLVVALAASALGLYWTTALAVGLILSLSSTAIVLQTLAEKGWLKSDGGQACFAVLLFQDIAVIFMFAVLPLLSLPSGTIDSMASVPGNGPATLEVHTESMSLVDGLAGWQYWVASLAAIAVVVGGGHYLSAPVFRFIARRALREMFTATALLVVIAIALLMRLVGLSPALGAFLAGVVLATSDYRHELEGDIEPFKGLLLGLFFITVGAGIELGVLSGRLAQVLGVAVGLMVLKALVLWLCTWVFRVRAADRWLIVLGVAQAGEFAFVLIAFGLQNSVMSQALADVLLLAVTLSMLFTPVLFIVYQRVIAPRYVQSQARGYDRIDAQGQVIIAGHGRFGQVVNRLLLANGYHTVVLDYKAELIDGLRKFGIRVFYGDASRPELLKAAGLQQAAVLVVAIDDQEQALKLIAHARRVRPDLHIVARAYDRRHVYQLYKSGTDDIVRETFDSASRAGRYTLQALGMRETQAREAVALFTEFDRDGVRRLAQVYDPDISLFENTAYVNLARQIQTELERIMSGHDNPQGARVEDIKDPPPG